MEDILLHSFSHFWKKITSNIIQISKNIYYKGVNKLFENIEYQGTL